MGADDTGAIAITDLVRVGQTVQFPTSGTPRPLTKTSEEHGRDRTASITRAPGSWGPWLFSCNGRGTRLFAEADHDVSVLRQRFGPIPVAGFFAMGEIGPVGGQNFVHGYTASVVLFEGPAPAAS